MTIARKLWIGFGVLILLSFLANLVIAVTLRSIDKSLEEIMAVEVPTASAAYEMEINAVEISREVLNYRQTGEERYKKIGTLYAEYAALSESLTETSGPASAADQRRFLELQTEIDALLDNEVQTWTGWQLKEANGVAEAGIRDVYRAILFTLLAGVVVGVGAATIIGRGILGSVGNLKEGAKRIGAGDLDYRIEANGRDDELSEVAVAFDDMLDRRREMDREFREAEARFRSLGEAAFEGVAITHEGRIVETNAAFDAMFGYAPGDSVGANVLDLVAPSSRERVAKYRAAGIEEVYEASLLKKDGTTFEGEIRGRRSVYGGMGSV